MTVLAEAPRLAPHREAIRAQVAQLLHLEPARVNLKATTTEGLGFLGRARRHRRAGRGAGARALMEPPRAECHAREVALAPPRALGCELLTGALRRTPEDFEVEEDLGFEPSGAGAHVLLKVRKRDANTAWVAGALARAAGCRTAEVGYAGLKDRRAIATQWFSVPRPRSAPEWTQLRGEGFEVLEAHAHGRKLPRGALAGNRFRVRIHAESGGGRALADALAPGLGAIARAGIPNYFGPQRFGREGANLARAQLPLAGLRPDERTFVLSAARSVIFNAVLARRVRAGTWGRLERGDLANLDGRGSVFAVAALDAELHRAGGAPRDPSHRSDVGAGRSLRVAAACRRWKSRPPRSCPRRRGCARPRACTRSAAACASPCMRLSSKWSRPRCDCVSV